MNTPPHPVEKYTAYVVDMPAHLQPLNEDAGLLDVIRAINLDRARSLAIYLRPTRYLIGDGFLEERFVIRPTTESPLPSADGIPLCSGTGCQEPSIGSLQELKEVPLWRHPLDQRDQVLFEPGATVFYCAKHEAEAKNPNPPTVSSRVEKAS